MASAGRSENQSRGFTLLEVIIAFVIMALIIGATLNVFSTGLRNTLVTGNYAEAVVHADSRLAVLEHIGFLQEGVRSGRFDQTYGWRTEVRPVISEQDRSSGPEPFQLYNIAVTVFWHDGRDSREVTLRSMRLKRTPGA